MRQLKLYIFYQKRTEFDDIVSNENWNRYKSSEYRYIVVYISYWKERKLQDV